MCSILDELKVVTSPRIGIEKYSRNFITRLQESTTANATHGFLLQIAYLLRAMKQNPHRIENKMLAEFLRLFLDIDLAYNSLTAKVYMDILFEILLK